MVTPPAMAVPGVARAPLCSPAVPRWPEERCDAPGTSCAVWRASVAWGSVTCWACGRSGPSGCALRLSCDSAPRADTQAPDAQGIEDANATSSLDVGAGCALPARPMTPSDRDSVHGREPMTPSIDDRGVAGGWGPPSGRRSAIRGTLERTRRIFGGNFWSSSPENPSQMRFSEFRTSAIGPHHDTRIGDPGDPSDPSDPRIGHPQSALGNRAIPELATRAIHRPERFTGSPNRTQTRPTANRPHGRSADQSRAPHFLIRSGR